MFENLLECSRQFENAQECSRISTMSENIVEFSRRFWTIEMTSCSLKFENVLVTGNGILESSEASSNAPLSCGSDTFQLRRVYISDGKTHALVYFWKSIKADQGKVKLIESEIKLR